ncbi:MAG: hypothetical protein VW985_12185 [Gammaproteobacteria bacterium]
MEDAAAGMLLVSLATMAMIVIAPVIFYLLTLQKILRLAGPNNRRMRPALVWLNLVPVFNLGWHLYTVIRISDTLQATLGIPVGKSGRWLGITAQLLLSGCLIPEYRGGFALGALILWVAYWIKLSGYSAYMQRQLAQVMDSESE